MSPFVQMAATLTRSSAEQPGRSAAVRAPDEYEVMVPRVYRPIGRTAVMLRELAKRESMTSIELAQASGLPASAVASCLRQAAAYRLVEFDQQDGAWRWMR